MPTTIFPSANNIGGGRTAREAYLSSAIKALQKYPFFIFGGDPIVDTDTKVARVSPFEALISGVYVKESAELTKQLPSVPYFYLFYVLTRDGLGNVTGGELQYNTTGNKVADAISIMHGSTSPSIAIVDDRLLGCNDKIYELIDQDEHTKTTPGGQWEAVPLTNPFSVPVAAEINSVIVSGQLTVTPRDGQARLHGRIYMTSDNGQASQETPNWISVEAFVTDEGTTTLVIPRTRFTVANKATLRGFYFKVQSSTGQSTDGLVIHNQKLMVELTNS